MRLALALLAVVALTTTASACAHSETPSTACGAIGSKCSSEGTTCSPAPIGTGWSHALMCQGGHWSELEIAPLPQPQPAASGGAGGGP